MSSWPTSLHSPARYRASGDTLICGPGAGREEGNPQSFVCLVLLGHLLRVTSDGHSCDSHSGLVPSGFVPGPVSIRFLSSLLSCEIGAGW